MWGRDKESGKGEVPVTNEDLSYGYSSDIKLGEQYRDKHSGVQGRAVMVSFFEHACERVVLEWVKDGDIKEAVFDAVRLESVEGEVSARVRKTGGPERGSAARATPPARSSSVR